MLLLVLFIYCCGDDQSMDKTTIKSLSFNPENRQSVKLPNILQELSGLAMTKDGRLFGHNDERADVYQINPDNGKIVKSFSLGKKTLKKDFEGIAIVDDLFYLVTSDGDLYKFKEGEDKSEVSYKKYETRLSSKNDVEGLCYDPDTETLLLACKGYPGRGYDGKRAVYSFSLSNKKLKKKPRFLISIKEVNNLTNPGIAQKLGDFFLLTENSFAPSGIARHPENHSFYILSSQGSTILEISADGELKGRILLDKKHHNQPEGITFAKNLSLLIGDEGGNGKAKITTYPATRNK